MIATFALAAALMLDPAGKTEPAATPTPVASEANKPSAKRYCVDAVLTGTRVPRRTCMTRADWLKQGFDPLAPAN